MLVFNSYGASLKHTFEDGTKEYAKVRPDADLDLEKAKRGEYTVNELIWREDNGCLGTYNGSPVYLKKGKFGLYAEYGGEDKNTISLKSIDNPQSIVLETVIDLIERKTSRISDSDAAAMFLPVSELGEDPKPAATTNKAILRVLRPDLSIRKGKYGPYIFHQTAAMSKPDFHPMKPVANKWQDMADLELITWIANTYRISI